MFRADRTKSALSRASAVLGWDARPLLGLTRAVFRRGGVLAVSRGGSSVILSLGGVAADGVFELASVSKPFTAALAGALVGTGRLVWDAPLSGLGGPFRGLPAQLTPRALATHTAGLPMHPARANLTVVTRFSDPYGGMTPRDVIASARRWARPSAAPRFVYSNLGMGLLGLAVAYAAGETADAGGFGRALERWVTGPLGLGVTLEPPAPVRPLGPLGEGALTRFGPLAGAGGLFGTAADLLTFGGAQLNGREAPATRRPAGLPAGVSGVAPGWLLSGESRWHDGRAHGTRSGLGLDLSSGTVVAVLARGPGPWLPGRADVPTLLLALLGVRA